jgi:uncharacterized repeat protein (TIGR01451 family)
MKKYLQLIFLLLFFTVTANAQVLRPFATKYYNPSVRGNIVYVSNSIISTAGVGSGVPGTGEVPPGGVTRNNAGIGINIDVDNPAPTVKIPFGSVWDYHAQNAAPANNPAPTDWKQPGYVLPATWNALGTAIPSIAILPPFPAKYGFANPAQPSIITCLKSSIALPACVPAAGVKYTAYYFRKQVNFTALELSTTFYNIQLNLLRNDGIVVYVNGVERIRDNMPGGAVNFATLASANIAPGAAEAVTYNLSPSFFVAGANTIAVEVHLRANNSADMSFDMQVLGLDNNGTYNSSTADLNLPSCSNVLFAGLYWGADQGISGTDSTWITPGFNTIKLKIPGASSYQTLTSTQTNRYSLAWSTSGFNHTGYLCFRDITSLINTSNANGTYTAADLTGPIGISNASGGWTIVIAFANPTFQPRNLSVFDGAVIVNLGDPAVDININGFLTPPTGPVSCELGAVVYDGDRSGTDSFAFKQNGAAAFYDLATTTVPLNGAADAWNSKISYKGSVVTARNPAFQNTLGYDAAIFDLPNVSNAQLGNGKTGATVRFSSPSENYFLQVLTASISQYNPTFSFEKTAVDLNGGSFLPGDSLLYKIKYTNWGNDTSTNTIITDNLPTGTAYIPGSIKIGATAKTDALGDDQAEYSTTLNRITFRMGIGANALSGGRIGPSQTDSVEFKVVSPNSCAIIGCIGSLRNTARISYGGKLSGSVLYDSSGVSTAGCIVQGPLIHPLTGPCFIPADTTLANCTGTSILIPTGRYVGYTFYSATPFVPANEFNPAVPINTTGTYWAFFTNGSGCGDTVRIQININSPSTGPTSITAPSTTICNLGSVTLTAAGGTLGTGANYQWGTGAVVGTGPIAGATSSTLTVSPTVTTTYWVRIENTFSPCASVTGGTTVTITVRQPSTAPSSVNGPDICNPGSTTLTAVGGILGTSANYQWGTGAVVGTSPIVGATGSTLTVSPTTTTTYWVRIENTAGPCAATTSGIIRMVTVNQPSIPPSSINGPAIICNGAPAVLSVMGGVLGTGANFQWGTGSVVGINPIGGATGFSIFVSPSSTTTYWVRIENTAGPCPANTSGQFKTVIVNQRSSEPTSITGADICNPGSTTLTAVGGTLGTNANYQWGTGAVVGISPIGGATGSTLTVSPTTTTTYWVRIENTSSPCPDMTTGITKTVTVNQPSVAPTSITGADFCNPGSTTLTALGATLGTSANYQWGTGAVIGTSPIVGATSSTLTVSPTSTTTYWVRMENTAGPCSANTSGLTRLITVNQPSVAATAAGRSKNNICPGISAKIYRTGGTLGTSAIWRWYTGSPGGTLIGSGDTLTVMPLVTTTYYLRAEGFCNTTAPQSVTIFISCDIDKDDDGIPDHIESNIAAATANGYNTGYAGYVDYNNDFINDNFQADGDSDNDGIPNYLDTDFPGRGDSNLDGIDDKFDTDLDGKINMLDLDSDNDGIPDVVEAYGVDTNGDGKIDNYTDTDGDGFSQNVDANNTGANNSSVGLGVINFDNDAVPNFLDVDSDNDGIPDVIEVGGPDTNNDGRIDGFVDANNDGLHDAYINATALLMTGTDTNGDGRADSYPNKNMDRDFRPNVYDMDSDGDGIVDVIEAGLPDADFNGIVDGVMGVNGWSTTVSAMPALNLRNTDASAGFDFLDIDSDNDGIPDNIEGQTTFGYKLPSLTDADGDGLMLPYDNLPAAFGGAGILVYDHDLDNTPDYRDLDTDADGLIDRVEGNDFNLNALPDDNVTLTGLDTDGDGLDNRFDSLNSVTNIKGTSYRMGNLGSFTGDATPGSRTTVQRSFTYQTDRDWRYTSYVLPVKFLKLTGLLQTNKVLLNWSIIADKEVDHFEVERSTDNRYYSKTGTVSKLIQLQQTENLAFTDDITNLNATIIYYRIKVISKSGDIQYSNILVIRKQQTGNRLSVTPNPAQDNVSVSFYAETQSDVTIRIIDKAGRTMILKTQKVNRGSNNVYLSELNKYANGAYIIQIYVNNEILNERLVIIN